MTGLRVPFVWAEDVLLHEPRAEIWVGVSTPGTELPARAQLIREALVAAGASETPAEAHEDEHLLAVHDPGLLTHLRTVHAEWTASGIPAMSGQDMVVPYVFPTDGLLGVSRCGNRQPSTPGPAAGATTR